LDEVSGKQAALDYAQHNYAWFDAHGLGETAMYQSARRLEELNRIAEARDTYVRTAKTYPYPDGGLFDDALFRASLLDEKLGQPEQAIAHLREMLSVREPATFSGSYERPRFSEAQMRIAELYRDALDEPAAARQEFRKLFREFETSSFRDDALWAEATIATKQGDEAGACEAVNLLVRELPDSRYAPCASLLCSAAPKPNMKKSCRRYVRRQMAGGGE
ncbi:MAG: tetratricopeptide repeat protein, partial [Polyangiaceae bacterium]|nr:tetratricopeptide repeat protein [Polyangiaceae bacterium]